MEGAKAAYQQAIDSEHPDAAPEAAVNMGELLERQRHADSVKAALQQAIDSGHADDAAWEAANKLEVLLPPLGDVEGVKAALQQVIDSGYPNAAPRAAFKLGYLLSHALDPHLVPVTGRPRRSGALARDRPPAQNGLAGTASRAFQDRNVTFTLFGSCANFVMGLRRVMYDALAQ